MNYNVLSDFKRVQSISEEEIHEYKGKLPEELLSVWGAYGHGTFMNGYLKIINPKVYQEVLVDSYFMEKKSFPIMVTGFGDVLTWEEDKYVGLAKYRKSQFNIISSGFKFFFSNLDDEYYLNKYFNVLQYKEAREKYGELNFDECFGYVPLLGLGGPEDVDHLDKVKIIEHIELVTELLGKIG